MREWLIALGILVIVAVLLDGVRRMRNARRDSLQIALDMNRGLDRNRLDGFDGDGISTARIVAQRDDFDDESDGQEEPGQALTESGMRKMLDLSQSVPILIDVKESQPRIEPGFDDEQDDESADDILSGSARTEPAVQDDNERVAARPPFGQVTNGPANHSSANNGSVNNGLATRQNPVLDSATTPLSAGESEILSPPRVYERPDDRPPPRREPPVKKATKPVVKAKQERELQMQLQQQEEQKASPQLPLEDMIIITVKARDRSRFPGAGLLEILLANGLRYGHHNIFHYYTGEEREDESVYSVVNAVKPGTFDLNQMDTFNTPAINLFLRLPTPGRALDAFESMLGTARDVCSKLNGELLDEHRSVMTAQTIEHCRQRIRDFEMQSRLRGR